MHFDPKNAHSGSATFSLTDRKGEKRKPEPPPQRRPPSEGRACARGVGGWLGGWVWGADVTPRATAAEGIGLGAVPRRAQPW